MNKICTTVEQSQRLMELGFDYNKADMCYDLGTGDAKASINCENFTAYYTADEYPEFKDRFIPAWSVAALLDFLPPYLYEFERGIDLNIYRNLSGRGWHCSYMPNCIENMKEDKFKLITNGDDLLDAGYEMVLKLYEMKLLKL